MACLRLLDRRQARADPGDRRRRGRTPAGPRSGRARTDRGRDDVSGDRRPAAAGHRAVGDAGARVLRRRRGRRTRRVDRHAAHRARPATARDSRCRSERSGPGRTSVEGRRGLRRPRRGHGPAPLRADHRRAPADDADRGRARPQRPADRQGLSRRDRRHSRPQPGSAPRLPGPAGAGLDGAAATGATHPGRPPRRADALRPPRPPPPRPPPPAGRIPCARSVRAATRADPWLVPVPAVPVTAANAVPATVPAPGTATAADPAGNRIADQVVIAPKAGLLARTLPAPGVPGEGLYLVTEDGAKFPVADDAAATALGHSTATATAVPADLLALLPTGPVLRTLGSGGG